MFVGGAGMCRKNNGGSWGSCFQTKCLVPEAYQSQTALDSSSHLFSSEGREEHSRDIPMLWCSRCPCLWSHISRSFLLTLTYPFFINQPVPHKLVPLSAFRLDKSFHSAQISISHGYSHSLSQVFVLFFRNLYGIPLDFLTLCFPFFPSLCDGSEVKFTQGVVLRFAFDANHKIACAVAPSGFIGLGLRTCNFC